MTPEQIDALKSTADILETEANQLARFMIDEMKVSFHRVGIDVGACKVQHRVAIACEREMERLRGYKERLLELVRNNKAD